MSSQNIRRAVVTVALASLMVSACFNPPHNNFKNDPRVLKGMTAGAAVGAGMGAVAGSVIGNTLAGAAVGGVAGSVVGLVSHNEKAVVNELATQDIQYVEYGDTRVLIIPTDRYFWINSHRIQDLCYEGLNNVARLLKYYPCTPIYVASFTDEIGSRAARNKLSQSRADAMVTFLWANGIRAQRLHAEGYGSQHAVGDNQLIHGSAYNRRVEIQWIKKAECPMESAHEAFESK